ncbi:PcfJ domain-containing protein [Megasphaera paucivorans]|uniref:PcfJ-like protein n=1 Tax=Megasphaera paucivorans TaxID=349095 RepID=A0A1G9QW59_9FIRM|nr:PcfJ domain-containing protein [Megasphaera paucivorans]SDM14485.1 hypothetical protein SAMN05660299_00281 [Megasphaera paucivorans]
MKILGYAETGLLWDVVQQYRGGSYYDGTESYPAIQMHVDCGHMFSCRWHLEDHYCHTYDEGQHFYCPKCGAQLIAYMGYFYETDREECIPLQMWFRVTETATTVNLEIKYQAVQSTPREEPLGLIRQQRRQRCTLQADIKNQCLYIKTSAGTTTVDMVAHPDWPETTPLRYLTYKSKASRERKGITDIFKLWRQTIEQKICKKLGYHVPSMYVGTSLQGRYGMFFNALQNIAWRLAAPTAPKYDRDSWEVLKNYDSEVLDYEKEVLARTSKGQEYYSAVCDAFALPQKKAMRKALKDKGLFSEILFQRAQHITSNFDMLLRIGQSIGPVRGAGRYYSEYGCEGAGFWRNEEVMKFLRRIARFYNDETVMRLLTKYCETLQDTARMYVQLTPKNKKVFWRQPHVGARDLHDAVMALHDKQKYANRVIPQTREMKALRDRISGLEFYTPEGTHQLNAISAALHNCVKSYGDRAVKHQCIIVGVRTGDTILACIEVRQGTLIQAKLLQNKLASSDARMNSIICGWVQKHHLTPCSDLQMPEQEQKAV